MNAQTTSPLLATLPKVTLEPLGIYSDGLHHFSADVQFAHAPAATVEFVSNQSLEQMQKADWLTALFHGFGINAAETFPDILAEAAQNTGQLVAALELHGAASVFPMGMELTPNVLTQIMAAVLLEAAPNAVDNNFFVGNSMGGLFMAGTADLLGRIRPTDPIHCLFDATMSPNILHDPSGPVGIETRAFLHTALCLVIKYAKFLLLPALNGLFRISFIVDWYSRTLFNQPTQKQYASVKALLKARPTNGQDIFRTLANIAENATQWLAMFGNKTTRLPGDAVILQSDSDAVFSGSPSAASVQNTFRTKDGKLIEIVRATGPHLPNAARWGQISRIIADIRERFKRR